VNIMKLLEQILSSRVRAEVFRLLFCDDARELHLREIARRSGLSIGAVRQELQKLVRLDLVARRRDGNRVYHRANSEHPLHREIRNLVLKTTGLRDVLRSVLLDPDVRVAFVFGSVARGEEVAGSDIDLMVIGRLGLRQLSRLLAGKTDQIGREINSHVMQEKEFGQRLAEGDHFVRNVMASPKLFIVGGDRELEAMGG
jgi:predicted nucleotidyltransferase